MLKESEEELFTLDDRMRLSLNKFKKMFSIALIIVIFVFIFSGYGLYKIFLIEIYLDELEVELPLLDDESVSYHATDVESAFEISLAVVIAAIAWMGFRGIKIHKELTYLQQQKIRQSYYLTFETMLPKGVTSTEKILYMITQVFPEIKEEKKKKEKKGKEFKYDEDKKIKNIVYNLSLKICDEGLLLVKFLDENTFDELKEIVKNTNKIKKQTKVFRLLCVSTNFDDVFQDYGFEERVNSLSRLFKLDLIEESPKGYSMAWID